MSRAISVLGPRQFILFILYGTFPKIMNKMGCNFFPDSVTNYFIDTVLKTMKFRELHHVHRPDMIQLLMKVKKEWSDDDIVAQAMLFLIAGYETVSSAMTFLLYELAVHPDVQDRVAAEIREHVLKNDGLNLDTIQNLTYLDMVVSETLRLWPSMMNLDRVCVKDYNLGKPNDTAKEDYIIRKGTRLGIPIWAFHRDPQYFPNPLKFDPERFSEENKIHIKPYTYMPFGDGPRACIGSRFALSEIKVMAYHLLRIFEVSLCERTCVPPVLDTTNLNLALKGGNWIRFKIREQEIQQIK